MTNFEETPDFFANVSVRRSQMNYNTFRLEFDDDGTLRQRGREGWREAICPKCGKTIRWVLDMASFVHMDDGSFALTHARCAWTKPAFDTQKAQAPDG